MTAAFEPRRLAAAPQRNALRPSLAPVARRAARPLPAARHELDALAASGAILQTSLEVGRSDDPLEHEAERIAERVVGRPSASSIALQRCTCGPVEGIDGECAECRAKRLGLQRLAVGEAGGAAPSLVTDVVAAGGQPLDVGTRRFFEQRLGHDLADVRVHADSRAAESARSVSARAYTVGNHVAFAAGAYQPSTDAGRRLLAHELVHTLQQRRGASSAGPQPAGITHDTAAPLRRALSVPFARTKLEITSEPSTGLEIRQLLGKWRALPKTLQQIVFSAEARPLCGQGDTARGYELGIVQIQTSDVNNGHYVGASPADGSLWIRRDTPAVRPPGPCHDSPWGRIDPRRSGALFWSQSSPASCATAVSLTHRDFPQDMYDTIVENPITHAPNYLSELHLAFDFVTALMLRRPDNTVEMLRWAGWSVSWDYTFDTPPSGESRVRRGISGSGTIVLVAPTPAPPGLPTRYALPAKNCNMITMEASDNPAKVEASAGQ